MAYEVLLVAGKSVDRVDEAMEEGRPYDLHVCETMKEAIECSEGRWAFWSRGPFQRQTAFVSTSMPKAEWEKP